MSRLLHSVCILAFALLTACDGESSMALPPDAVVFRADTSVTAYFGTPVNWSDTVWLELHAHGRRAFGEPPLRGASIKPNTFVLRFFWQRTFHPSVAVRVTRSTQGCGLVMTVKQNDMFLLPLLGSGEPPVLVPGTRLRKDSFALAVHTCDDLAARLDKIGLTAGGPWVQRRGVEGADWVFERLDTRGHTALLSWSPDCSTACSVFTAGMAFLQAAHALPSGPGELY